MAGTGTSHLRSDNDDVVLDAQHLVVVFPTQRGHVHAVSDVSLDLLDGETLGIVGESGCGKSTTGKAIMQVPPPVAGSVKLNDVDLASLDSGDLRAARSQLQMVFQDASSSLNPRRTIRDIVSEPLTVQWLESHPRSPAIRLWERYVPWMLRIWRHRFVRRVAAPALITFFAGLIVWVIGTALGTEQPDGTRDGGIIEVVGNVAMIASLIALAPVVALFLVTALLWLVLSILVPVTALRRLIRIRRARPAFRQEATEKVRRVLDDVGIDPDLALDRRPHEFSGGQAQRISIARALIVDPKVIVCDEPVSALDVSVQAQVLNLLEDLKGKYGISLIFIAHDLAVVKNISDRVVVMYLGKVCEVAEPDQLFSNPRHPYSSFLIRAIPVVDPSVDPRLTSSIGGDLPSPIDPPAGCRFKTRCPNATEQCNEEPIIHEISVGHFVACHHPTPPGGPLAGDSLSAAADGEPDAGAVANNGTRPATETSSLL